MVTSRGVVQADVDDGRVATPGGYRLRMEERPTAREYFAPAVGLALRVAGWTTRDMRPARLGSWHWATLAYLAGLVAAAALTFDIYLDERNDPDGGSEFFAILIVMYTFPLGMLTGMAAVPLAWTLGQRHEGLGVALGIGFVALGGLLQAAMVWRFATRAMARERERVARRRTVLERPSRDLPGEFSAPGNGRRSWTRGLVALTASAGTAAVAFAALFAWDTERNSDGTGPAEAWQVALLILVLLLVAAAAGWGGQPVAGTVGATLAVTVAWSTWAVAGMNEDDEGSALAAVGAVFLTVGTALGVGLAATAAQRVREAGEGRRAAAGLKSSMWLFGFGVLVAGAVGDWILVTVCVFALSAAMLVYGVRFADDAEEDA